jgi:hypothetical protein
VRKSKKSATVDGKSIGRSDFAANLGALPDGLETSLLFNESPRNVEQETTLNIQLFDLVLF